MCEFVSRVYTKSDFWKSPFSISTVSTRKEWLNQFSNFHKKNIIKIVNKYLYFSLQIFGFLNIMELQKYDKIKYSLFEQNQIKKLK